MAECAVIFDVDGVLLDLTRDEEEIFFAALSKYVPTQNLSRDWNSYKIRNDEDIVAEILERNHLSADLKMEVVDHYIAVLKSSAVKAVSVSGAVDLVNSLRSKAHIGIATANVLEAARYRLLQANLWRAVSNHAIGADGGGHKSTILKRTLETFASRPNRIIYVGDNLNDLAAAMANDVTFIGFSANEARRKSLYRAGAQHVSANHLKTMQMITKMLS